MVSDPRSTNQIPQSDNSTDEEGEEVTMTEEEFSQINAQLDALLNYMDVLEAQGDRICDAARQLVNECQQQNRLLNSSHSEKQA